MKTPQWHPVLIRFMPFIIIAIMIAIFILALFVFSYVFIAAIVIGLITFVVGFIRTKFFGYKKNKMFSESFFVIKTNFNKNNASETNQPTNKKSGRVIEHNDDTV